MKNNNTQTLTKQQLKQKQKEEKRKQLEKVIESHSLKYYGYFNIIFSLLIFLVLFVSLILSSIVLYQNKKLYNLLDDNKNITEVSAYSLQVEVTPYDTITDLTGTTWVFNNYLYIPENFEYITFNINFLSNNTNYTNLILEIEFDDNRMYYGRLTNIVYEYGLWSNEAYKTIEITGGTDATNSTFINWLQANATQLQSSIPQLTTPTLTYQTLTSGVHAGYTQLSWTSDNNAVSYEIYKDNTLISTQSAFVDGIPQNDYLLSSTGTYQVKSIGDGTNYDDSDLSNSVTLTSSQLLSPTISLNNLVVSWSAITNATNYEIYKDNTLLTTIATTSYNISSAGTYQVKAINTSGSSFLYTASNLSNIVTFTPYQISTPFLDSGLNYANGYVLSWSASTLPNLTKSFEIYKDNVLLDTTTNQTYTVTQNGSYKVKQVSTNFQYIDSNFSNVVTISNLYHVTFNLPNNTSSRTFYANNNSSVLDDFYFVFDNFTDTYPYTIFTIDNTNQNNGYVFRENTSIVLDNGSCQFNYEFIDIFHVKIKYTSVSSDFEISVTNYDTILINGSYAFIGSQNYSYDNLPTAISIPFVFTSNGLHFNTFLVDTTNQNISYINTSNQLKVVIFNYIYNIDNQYFLFNYVNQNTGNYLFIEVDNQFIDVDLYFDYFVNYYRVATLQDYENLGYQNGIIDANQYTMANLLFALADTPVKLVRGLLNFNFFGVNLFGLFSLIVTVLCVWAMFHFIKGGKSNDKK